MNLYKTMFYFLFTVTFSWFFVQASFFDMSFVKGKTDESLFSLQGKYFGFSDDGKKQLISPEKNKDSYSLYLFEEEGGLFSVYFSGVFQKKSEGQTRVTQNYVMGQGMFFIDNKDMVYERVVFGKNFSFKWITPGKIWVDTIETQVSVVVFDAMGELVFFDNTGKEVNRILLYPHMYISFFPGKNNFLRNVNFLRLQQLTTIGYETKLIDFMKNSWNDAFLSRMYSQEERKKRATVFFERVFRISQEQGNSLGSKNDFLREILYFQVRGEEFIATYEGMLVNTEKKRRYYFSQFIEVLRHFSDTSLQKEKKQALLDRMGSILQTMEKNDEEMYKKSLYVLSQYAWYRYEDGKGDAFNDIILLYDFFHRFFQKQGMYQGKSLLLSKMYKEIDEGKADSGYFFSYLLEYSNMLVASFGGKQLTPYEFLLSESDLSSSKGMNVFSFVFFLHNVLASNIPIRDENQFIQLTQVLQSYISFQESFMESNMVTREKTIIELYQVANNIETSFTRTFFEKDRNKRGLLVLKRDVIVSKDALDSFYKGVKRMITVYKNNAGALPQKYAMYHDVYKKLEERFQEMYSALSNYSQYEQDYDKVFGGLLSSATVVEKGEDRILTEEYVKQFLSQFSGIRGENIHIEIINKVSAPEERHFKIKNMNIDGNTIDFELYPFQGHLIKNIYKNGEFIRATYSLDEIQLQYAVASSQQDGQQMAGEMGAGEDTFRNFFVSVFGKKTVSMSEQKEKFVDDFYASKTNVFSNISKEQRLIDMFKREKLFGKTGEFSVLGRVLTIEEKHVQIHLQEDSYDITIQNAPFSVQTDGKNYCGFLSSRYIFSQKDHFFEGIELRFCECSQWNREEGSCGLFLFGGKKFEIGTPLHIMEVEDELKKKVPELFSR